MKDTYITATLDLLRQGEEPASVLAGLQKVQAARGHSALYAPVLRGVMRVLEAARPTTVVTVADEALYTAQQAAISAALQTLGAMTEPAVTIDNTLIGGFVAEHELTRIDASYKTKLVDLYRSLTS